MERGEVRATLTPSPAGLRPEQQASKLALEGITFSYDGTAAVEDVSVSLRSGEFVSLLGPSGCGKTTLLRIVAGLLRPERGRVLLDGRDITRLRPEKRPLGMVFQHLALFPHLSVEENVGFSLRLRRAPKATVRARVQAMLELVGLGWAGSRSVSQLSGGQQQRVALARSLITEPEILLLDEPLGALDLQIRKEMQAELKNLQRRVGITFIFVTHDQTEAMAMSDRIVLMREGRIVQDGPPEDVYRGPADAFAARFVGETNLLNGRVRENGGDLLTISIEAGELRLPGRYDFTPNEEVAISIRPEHLVLTLGDSDYALRGQVITRTFLGYEVLIEVDTSLGPLRLRRAADEALDFGEVGETVGVAYDPARVHVFPATRRE